jgi:hypothetical protein
MVGPEVATPHHKHSEQKDPCLGPEQNECLGMVGPEVATPHHKHSEQKDPCLGTVGPEVATPHHKHPKIFSIKQTRGPSVALGSTLQ